MTDDLARYVTAQLKHLADPEKAPAMAAYMKTAQPFFGVSTPLRTAMLKKMGERFTPADQKSYARGVMALWKLPHREEQYCAISFASRARGQTTYLIKCETRGGFTLPSAGVTPAPGIEREALWPVPDRRGTIFILTRKVFADDGTR
jgi:DNA alkylation repair enzyme